MDLAKMRTLMGDDTLTSEAMSVLLDRAKKLAKNQHYWRPDDNPTDAELEKFYDRYEYEIIGIAKEINSADARGGLKEFSELGVTRKWESGGAKSLEIAVAVIPPKTYLI